MSTHRTSHNGTYRSRITRPPRRVRNQRVMPLLPLPPCRYEDTVFPARLPNLNSPFEPPRHELMHESFIFAITADVEAFDHRSLLGSDGSEVRDGVGIHIQASEDGEFAQVEAGAGVEDRKRLCSNLSACPGQRWLGYW